MEDFKALLATPAGKNFNTNVLKIALNLTEEKIGSIIVSLFEVRIEEDMILRAIKTG